MRKSISEIQQIMNQTSQLEKTLSNRQISNRIEGSIRQGDECFKKVCSEAKSNISDDYRQKLSNSAWKKKIIVTPFGEFDSVKDFKEQTGFIFSEKKKSMPHLYYNKDDGPGNITYEKIAYTPYGIIPLALGKVADKYNVLSIKKVYNIAKANGQENALKNNDFGDWFNYMIKYHGSDYYKKKEIKREWFLEDNSN